MAVGSSCSISQQIIPLIAIIVSVIFMKDQSTQTRRETCLHLRGKANIELTKQVYRCTSSYMRSCGSPVSDGLGLCFSFNPYLRKSLLSQNEGLKLVWIVNVYRRSFSRATANAIDTSENKITIGPGKADDTLQHDKDKAVMYNGPISETIRRVKLLSLSTCCLSVSLGPVITFLTSPGLNVIVKGAVASCVIFISASTTAALHWFASPYVHKLRWQPGADSFEVEVLSWLATYVPRTIKFSDVKPPQTNRPYVTFKANGNFYFIDAERCQNKALLAKLTPKEPSTTSTVKNL